MATGTKNTEGRKVITRDRTKGLLVRALRLTQEHIDKARAMGDGNLSRGIRTAIDGQYEANVTQEVGQ